MFSPFQAAKKVAGTFQQILKFFTAQNLQKNKSFFSPRGSAGVATLTIFLVLQIFTICLPFLSVKALLQAVRF